jgi:hypothetical protein
MNVYKSSADEDGYDNLISCSHALHFAIFSAVITVTR